jgi:predicted ArsR family transcriptional regulator
MKPKERNEVIMALEDEEVIKVVTEKSNGKGRPSIRYYPR